MSWKKFLKPSLLKVLVTLFLLSFFSVLTGPVLQVYGISLPIFGFPLPFIYFKSFLAAVLVFDLVVFYLLSSVFLLGFSKSKNWSDFVSFNRNKLLLLIVLLFFSLLFGYSWMFVSFGLFVLGVLLGAAVPFLGMTLNLLSSTAPSFAIRGWQLAIMAVVFLVPSLIYSYLLACTLYQILFKK